MSDAPSCTSTASRVLSIRMGPGENVCTRLCVELSNVGAGAGSVTSCVGSLSRLVYAVAELPSNGGLVAYSDRQMITGAIEVGSLQGHLGRDLSGQPAFHLHGVFALADGTLVGGHVFDAQVLATLEVSLLIPEGITWRAEPLTATGSGEPLPGLRVFVPRRSS